GSSLEHVADPPADFSSQDFWRWVRDNTSWDIFSGDANPLANSRAVAGAIGWRGRGMPGYFDVAMGQEGASVRFAVRVTRPAHALATTDNASAVRIGSGFLRMGARLPHDEIAAASAAEAWFERPVERRDGKNELASLFSPF